MKKRKEDNLKNTAVAVTLIHPNFNEPFRSIRDAARWLGNDILGLENAYVSVEVLNFLRKTGLSLSGNHELNGLRVVERQSYIPNKSLTPQEPSLPYLTQEPQEPYVPYVPQMNTHLSTEDNTSVDRTEEICRQKDTLLKTEEVVSVDREISSGGKPVNECTAEDVDIVFSDFN